MGWNHRIIKTKDGEDDWYQIHEVHYDENEEIIAHTERGSIVGGNSLEDIKWTLEKMIESLSKEVINQNKEDE
jgi:hypothetical protein